MSNLGINFVNADNAGLVFRIETSEGNIFRRADTIEDGVYWVQRYGWSDGIYFSSDMDFASEEGFETDDAAKKMFDKIMTQATA